MTDIDFALRELDARFAEHIAAEAARMRGEGMGQAVIDAVIAENRRRYAERREAAAAWVVSGEPATNDNFAAMQPEGTA